jgi:2-polyprenyl-6-methoxyphenol hydroxylase-like FAD-dependent oxidoreductase
MTDAMALAEALGRFESVEAALDAWDAVQAGVGNQLVALSRSLGSAMVTDVPDWSTMDAADMKTWFDKAVGGRSWYAVDEAAGR